MQSLETVLSGTKKSESWASAAQGHSEEEGLRHRRNWYKLHAAFYSDFICFSLLSHKIPVSLHTQDFPFSQQWVQGFSPLWGGWVWCYEMWKAEKAKERCPLPAQQELCMDFTAHLSPEKLPQSSAGRGEITSWASWQDVAEIWVSQGRTLWAIESSSRHPGCGSHKPQGSPVSPAFGGQAPVPILQEPCPKLHGYLHRPRSCALEQELQLMGCSSGWCASLTVILTQILCIDQYLLEMREELGINVTECYS